MFGAYVRFRYNYAALRKSSDNQQQQNEIKSVIFILLLLYILLKCMLLCIGQCPCSAMKFELN